MQIIPSLIALICTYIQMRGGGAQIAGKLDARETGKALEAIYLTIRCS
jgi:hypothetical protein